MLSLGNLPTTDVMREADLNSHMHPFTDHDSIGTDDLRVITSASGVFIGDSEGNQILDGMAGLWCVNVGYGRTEIAEAAANENKDSSELKMRENLFIQKLWNSFMRKKMEPSNS